MSLSDLIALGVLLAVGVALLARSRPSVQRS